MAAAPQPSGCLLPLCTAFPSVSSQAKTVFLLSNFDGTNVWLLGSPQTVIYPETYTFWTERHGLFMNFRDLYYPLHITFLQYRKLKDFYFFY